MRVAIVHYHLRRGGVTRVIENAVAALKQQDVECVVLSGEAYGGDAQLDVRVVEGLAYGPDVQQETSAQVLADKLLCVASGAFEGNEPDVWHIHNHSLGKHPMFPWALETLLESGRKALLQIHDFAEDGRPPNYEVLNSTVDGHRLLDEAKHCYPLGPGIAYAALNSRDRDFLIQSGAPKSQVHLLPNPVYVPGLGGEGEGERPFPDAATFYLYPTRGIRRKNIGEAALLAACAPEGTVIATTMGPDNPAWKDIHQGWEDFARELRLPLHLAVAEEGYAFPDLIRRADALLTTSIAEGFGLAFLEPWAMGKPLIGRNLPEITRDFRQQGIDLGGLYDALQVPVSSFGLDAFRLRVASALRSYYDTYHLRFHPRLADSAFDAWVNNGEIDFGVLDETAQMEVIRETLSSGSLRDRVKAQAFPKDPSAALEANQAAVATHYSLGAYSEQLMKIYQRLADAPDAAPYDAIAPRELLACFMDVARFRLLRS